MTQHLDSARKTLEHTSRAILQAAASLDESFERAVGLVAAHPRKIVCTGIGKSGRVAGLLAATFSSTGTPAVFLHAAEALHGDCGVLETGDPVIVVSKSGASEELVKLLPVLARNQSPIIAITGGLSSPIAVAASAVLNAGAESEADPHNLVPSTSTSVALAIGHALAIAVMTKKGFHPAHFAERHPEGELGWLLTRTVREVMLDGESIARVTAASSLRDVIIQMTRWPSGAACVVGESQELEGLITDGDIRRCLERFSDIRSVKASDVLTQQPIVAMPEWTLFDALRTMENRPRQLSVLPVVDDRRLIGMLRLHDVVRTQIR